MKNFGVWLVAAFLMVLLLESEPRVGGALLLVLVAYLAIQIEKKGAMR